MVITTYQIVGREAFKFVGKELKNEKNDVPKVIVLFYILKTLSMVQLLFGEWQTEANKYDLLIGIPINGRV